MNCDGCDASADDVLIKTLHLCERCYDANADRIAAVKLRLSGDVDWDDIKKYGIFDRFGVPIATVLHVVQDYARASTAMMMTTGPMVASPPVIPASTLTLTVKPLRPPTIP